MTTAVLGVILSMGLAFIGFFLFEKQIGYALGVYLVALFGAMLATFIGMGFKFSFKNRKFFYSLNSTIIFSTIIFTIT